MNKSNQTLILMFVGWVLMCLACSSGDEKGATTSAPPIPHPTPIPRIKCYPVESNGKIVDWRCVDVPPECVPEPKHPKRTEVK